MKIFIGLGNPGAKYENTRHNVGFLALDKLISHPELKPVDNDIKLTEDKKFRSLMAERNIKGEKIIFAKPLTFMNSSGEAVKRIADFYNADKYDIVILSDDIDLTCGRSRIRMNGKSGGHKGLQNIIDSLQAEDFYRVRIGIGNKNKMGMGEIDTKNYVLSKIPEKELPLINSAIEKAVQHLVFFIGKKEKISSHTFESFNENVV